MVKYALQYINADAFVFIRFILAGVLLLPIFLFSRYRFDKYALVFGIILGIINSGTFVFQAYALELTSTSRVAFLTALNIIMVPFLAPCFGLKLPKIIDLIAACIAIIGVYIISGANFKHLNLGDLYVLLSALCIAIGIIIVDIASRKTTQYKLFTFYQIIITAFIPFVNSYKTNYTQAISMPIVWLIILYCVIFATVIALVLQVKYQQFVSVNKVALILSLETLFGVFFAYLWGDTITVDVLIGGGILFFGVIVTDIYKLVLNFINNK